MIGPIKALYDRDPAGFLYACLAYVLSLAVTPMIPVYLLVVYLYVYETFSYDIFLPNVFGLGLFATLAAIFLMATAILQFGSLGFLFVPLFRPKKKGDRNQADTNDEEADAATDQEDDTSSRRGAGLWAKIEFGYTTILAIVLLVFNISINRLMIQSLQESTPESRSQAGQLFFAVSVLSLALVAYGSAMLSGNHKAIFASLLALLLLLGLTTIHSPEYTAIVTGKALSVFGIGGLKPVEVEMASESEPPKVIESKLVLLGPSTAILLHGEECSEIVILDRYSIAEIRLDRSRRDRGTCSNNAATQVNEALDSKSPE